MKTALPDGLSDDLVGGVFPPGPYHDLLHGELFLPQGEIEVDRFIGDSHIPFLLFVTDMLANDGVFPGCEVQDIFPFGV